MVIKTAEVPIVTGAFGRRIQTPHRCSTNVEGTRIAVITIDLRPRDTSTFYTRADLCAFISVLATPSVSIMGAAGDLIAAIEGTVVVVLTDDGFR